MAAKKTETGELIHSRMVAVMSDVGAIEKNQTNRFDKYNFRGIDDLYNALHPLFCRHGVFVVPVVRSCTQAVMKTTKGAEMQTALVDCEYRFYAEDGSCVAAAAPGEGADRGDKAVNKAMSSAFKTVLLQTFCIPTEEASDSEHDSPDLSGARRARTERDAPPAAPPKQQSPGGGASTSETAGPAIADPKLEGQFFFPAGVQMPADPGNNWLGVAVKTGKMAGKTWAELQQGSFRGQRYHYLVALVTFERTEEEEEKFASTRARASRALYEIERRERLRLAAEGADATSEQSAAFS